MEKEHLHLLIHEEIYQLPEDQTSQKDYTETAEPSIVAKPEPEAVTTIQEDVSIQENGAEDHSKEIAFAVFHDSVNEGEIVLLHKIIAACNIPDEHYQIFNTGFDQTVKFKKALVFVPEAKAFYTPIPYKNSEFLCSKPLSQLASDQNEKAKLWGALQKFIG